MTTWSYHNWWPHDPVILKDDVILSYLKTTWSCHIWWPRDPVILDDHVTLSYLMTTWPCHTWLPRDPVICRRRVLNPGQSGAFHGLRWMSDLFIHGTVYVKTDKISIMESFNDQWRNISCLRNQIMTNTPGWQVSTDHESDALPTAPRRPCYGVRLTGIHRSRVRCATHCTTPSFL